MIWRHLQNFLQRLGRAFARLQVLLPDIRDRHPQGQFGCLVLCPRLDVGVLAQNIDQVVPPLIGAQNPLEFQERHPVRVVGSQDLVQESHGLIQIRQPLLRVLRQPEQHRNLGGTLDGSHPAQQDFLQRGPVFAPLLDGLQSAQDIGIVGRTIQRLAIRVRGAVQITQRARADSADARHQRPARDRIALEPGTLGENLAQFSHLSLAVQQPGHFGQYLGVSFLGFAQHLPIRQCRRYIALCLSNPGRLRQARTPGGGIELRRCASLQNARQRRLIAARSVVRFQGRQRVDVLGILAEHAHVQAFRRRALTGHRLVEPRRAQRQLVRRGRIRAGECRLDQPRHLGEMSGNPRDTLERVDRLAWYRLVRQSASQCLDGLLGLTEPLFINLGDAPQARGLI